MALHHSPSIVKDGLVLYLDAANAKSYPGTGTTWTDISGNGNNATLINGPTFNNGSIVFDGVNDYADTGKTFSDVFTGTNSFTISCWVNPQSTQVAYADIWGNHGGAGGADNSGIVLQQNNTTNNYYTFAYGTGSTFVFSSYFNLTPNAYNNLVVARNSSYVSIYINGARIAYDNLTSSLSAPTVSFKIALGWTSNRYLKGSISNFAIYNRELPQIEVQQNFNALRSRYNI